MFLRDLTNIDLYQLMISDDFLMNENRYIWIDIWLLTSVLLFIIPYIQIRYPLEIGIVCYFDHVQPQTNSREILSTVVDSLWNSELEWVFPWEMSYAYIDHLRIA